MSARVSFALLEELMATASIIGRGLKSGRFATAPADSGLLCLPKRHGCAHRPRPGWLAGRNRPTFPVSDPVISAAAPRALRLFVSAALFHRDPQRLRPHHPRRLIHACWLSLPKAGGDSRFAFFPSVLMMFFWAPLGWWLGRDAVPLAGRGGWGFVVAVACYVVYDHPVARLPQGRP